MLNQGKFLRRYWSDPERLVHWTRTMGAEPPSVGAANKWFQRESVPTEWFGTLLALLEIERGKPVSLIEFHQ